MMRGCYICKDRLDPLMESSYEIDRHRWVCSRECRDKWFELYYTDLIESFTWEQSE